MIICQAHDAAVSLRDRLHNGQPQTGAPPGAGRRSKTDEWMGQIAVDEASAMITDPNLNSVSAALTDQLYFPRTMRQRIVHQVAQGILQALPVRGDHAGV
jgi:hypothetical protein